MALLLGEWTQGRGPCGFGSGCTKGSEYLSVLYRGASGRCYCFWRQGVQLALWMSQFMGWAVAAEGPEQAPVKCAALAGTPAVQACGHTALDPSFYLGYAFFSFL